MELFCTGNLQIASLKIDEWKYILKQASSCSKTHFSWHHASCTKSHDDRITICKNRCLTLISSYRIGVLMRLQSTVWLLYNVSKQHTTPFTIFRSCTYNTCTQNEHLLEERKQMKYAVWELTETFITMVQNCYYRGVKRPKYAGMSWSSIVTTLFWVYISDLVLLCLAEKYFTHFLYKCISLTSLMLAIADECN